MLPPRDLYHPVLPYRNNNKLYFPLCRTCTELHSSEKCQHDEEDRNLSGTWVNTELEEFIYLFGVLRRFQHCTGHITTGSWKGRGNQYIQFVRVLYCKLPTNSKQLPAFPLETMRGSNPSLRGGRREQNVSMLLLKTMDLKDAQNWTSCSKLKNLKPKSSFE